ncbi:MAG: nidogen-like domain-containing protein [Pseudomonadota bacterium]
MATTLPDTAYQSVLTSTAALWHSGGGSIGFTFLQTMPDSYVEEDEILVAGRSFDLDIDPSIGLAEETMLRGTLARLNEVAGLGLVERVDTPAPAGGPSAMVGGLGGSAGYGEVTVPRSDDGYFVYDITSIFPQGINVYGTVYDEMFVNTNGSVSFGNGVLAYSPRAIEAGYTPMFAPFWADIDTRAGALKGDESGEIHIDFDIAAQIITVTWDSVNYYDRQGKAQNSFQLQLEYKGSANFNLMFRYGDINWVSGDASGGSNGIGGTVATAGVTAGNGAAGSHIAIPGSGKQGKMLALETTPGNTGEAGLWQFKGRDGSLLMLPDLESEAAEPQADPIVELGEILLGALDLGADGFDALAASPGSTQKAGDVWLNTAGPDFSRAGGEGQAAALAALGKALGLSKTSSTGTLPAAFDTRLYTMMSENPVPGQGSGAEAAPQTPMLLDIQALQAAYGANLDTRAGDDVYFAPGGTTPFTIEDGQTLVATIWDAGGVDTFSAANQSQRVEIDLRPGQFSQIGAEFASIGIAQGISGLWARSALIENAIGGDGDDSLTGTGLENTLTGGAGADLLQGLGGDDLLTGNAGADDLKGGGGHDRLFGGAGSDVLKGQTGKDRLIGGLDDDDLFGGGGADIFVFQPFGGKDKVRDFKNNADKIDVAEFSTGFEALTITEIERGRVKIAIGSEVITLIDPNGNLGANDITAEDFTGLL